MGLDGSDCSRTALEWALRQATMTGARVDAIAAWEWRAQYGIPPYGASEAVQQGWTEDLLAQEIGKLAPADAAIVTYRAVRGNAAAVLASASAQADMIVVGNRGSGTAIGRMLGSVSQKVARHAQVPVVIVHDHDRHSFGPDMLTESHRTD